MSNQLTLLTARGERSPSHLAIARRCERIAPDKFIAVFNLASQQMRAGLHHESVQTFMRALNMADASQQALALQHIGLAWCSAGNPEEALKWYARAEVLAPDDKLLKQSIAISRLMNGDLTALFEFECKHYTPRRKPIAESGIPRWMGEDVSSKTVIAAHEQGNGDTIQFARFIPQIKARRLIWSGPDAISGLVLDNFRFDGTVDEAGPFDADYYCSPISACGALRVDYVSVDSSPYLKAEPIKLPKTGKLKIGLAWAGNVDYAHDADRSLRLEELMPMLETPGTAYYSLQVGRGEEDITRLGLDGLIANLGGTFKNWRDTANAIAALDLIVTVDTGAAHVAGALGKPVFILLPYSNCWRWMKDRTDTPWYASARLFRQFTPGNWAEPVQWVKRAIEDRLNG